MSSKYELYCFANGRVVFVDKEDIDKALEAEKEILVVCNAWSGGYTYIIGANKVPNYDGVTDENGNEFEFCYEMYGDEVRDETFTSEELANRFYKIIFTSGTMVFMKSGGQATYHGYGNGFIDWDSRDCDVIDKIKQDAGKSSCDFMATSDEMVKKYRNTVNTQHTVNSILARFNDPDRKEKVQCLIDYDVVDKDEAEKLLKNKGE